MNRLQQIQDRQAAIKARLAELETMPEPDGDEVARSAVLVERQTETDGLLDEWDALDAESKPLIARAQRVDVVRSAAAVVGNRETSFPAAPNVIVKTDPYDNLEIVRSGRFRDEDVLERAKYAIEQAPKHMSELARAHVMTLVQFDPEDENRQAALIARHLLMTGSPEYHEQFREYVRSGYQGELLRAAMSLTDANGGYLVPFTLDPTIMITNDGIVDEIRSISSVEQIATDSWNGVTSAGISTSWTAEGAEASDGSPTFGQPTIVPKKADAWVQGSYEMLADSGFASQFGRLLQDAKMMHEGAAFATANSGATRPRGVVADVAAVTTSLVASATTNALVVGDVYRLKGALRARDKKVAKFLANDAIYDKIRQFDTAGGSAFWANLHGDTPEELLGKATYEASTMQSAVTTAGLVLLAGNFQHFKIVDRIGMSVQYNPMVMGITNQRPTGSAGWYAFWRVGSGVTDPAAFRLLQLNSTVAAVPLA